MRNIKALKSFKGKEGFFYKGHIRKVKKEYANQLIKKGLAEEAKEAKEDKKKVKEDVVEIKVDAPEEKKEDKKKVKK